MTTIRFFDRTTPPHVATLILITSMATLSMNLFLPSLPAMTDFFGTSYGIMQIAVAGYLGVNAILQLIIGPLSDKFGRRNVLLICIAVFILASIGCALATDIRVFLGFRMIQAAIVAGIALPRAAIRDQMSADRAAAMIGWVTMGMSVGPMIAPAFGGALQDLFGWQANFWVLSILGVAGFALIFGDMGETARRSSSSVAAQFAQYPELIGSPRFWGYSLTVAFSSGAFFAYVGGAPYVGSVVFGLSPALLGVFFGAPALGYFAGNGISGRFSARIGLRNMILGGAAIVLTGLLVSLAVALAGYATALTFFGFMTLVGLGNGMVIPNGTAGALSVRPHLAGMASGLSGAIMIGGGAALSAIAGLVLTGAQTAIPLIVLMTASAVLSIISVAYVIQREKRLGLETTPEPAEDASESPAHR